VGNGGQGGFGGGGGGGVSRAGFFRIRNHGGDGGTRGGGGAALDCLLWWCETIPGKGGAFGGHADELHGGGGGALGGAYSTTTVPSMCITARFSIISWHEVFGAHTRHDDT
jgi:hypothetical protein